MNTPRNREDLLEWFHKLCASPEPLHEKTFLLMNYLAGLMMTRRMWVPRLGEVLLTRSTHPDFLDYGITYLTVTQGFGWEVRKNVYDAVHAEVLRQAPGEDPMDVLRGL